MTDALDRPAMRLRMSGISRIISLVGDLSHRATRVAAPDIGLATDARLRDIGMLDGRGPSLRRPERNPDRFGRCS
ncbi:MAG: hypothetical protein CL535_08660 [Ahrensia sp.]|nr:hypothetical protein [Ahrensia sp.]